MGAKKSKSRSETDSGRPPVRPQPPPPRISDERFHSNYNAHEALPPRSSDAVSTDIGPQSEYYSMNFLHRGIAVIISNETFDASLNLGTRHGTDQDASALAALFEEMEFDVWSKKDLTKQEMLSILQKAANMDVYNRQSDCFIAAILSHGTEGLVYATDGEVEVKTIMEFFKGNNSNGLVGKPKIFFIQACRGHLKDSGVDVHMTDNINDPPGRMEIVYKIPTDADFYIGYAVVTGKVSYRLRCTGSTFIRTICEVFKDKWKTTDLLRMMTEVKRKVAFDFQSYNPEIPSRHNKKQMPSGEDTLTKTVLFKPKHPLAYYQY